jgi:hypothetical protein
VLLEREARQSLTPRNGSRALDRRRARNGHDPELMIALAFRELAENAGKIGELNVTPDLLKSLTTASGR